MDKQENISVNIEFDNDKHAYMHEEIATSSDGIYRLIKSGKSLIMQGDEGEVELSMEHLFLEMINAHKNKGKTKTKVDAFMEALKAARWLIDETVCIICDGSGILEDCNGEVGIKTACPWCEEQDRFKAALASIKEAK